MAGYIGSKAVLLSTTAATVTGDAEIGGSLTVDTNTLFVDSTNNRVGIGTTSPSAALNVVSPTTQATFEGSIQGNIIVQKSGTNGVSIYSDAAGTLAFYDNNSAAERMRIDSPGNLLVGTTDTDVSDNTTGGGFVVTPSNGVSIAREGSTSARPVLALNQTGVDGEILKLLKDGTSVAAIGAVQTSFGVKNAYIGTVNTVGAGVTLVFNQSGADSIYPADQNGSARDNAIDMGDAVSRFDDVYATNGTIQTSDANEKQQIAELTAAEMDAAKAISKLFKTFKWNDSVAEKGDDARIHSGVIAQEVEAAMADAGLDAGKYAFFISSTWWEADGQTYDTAEEAPEGAVERTRKGIRYPQLLSFIGAATEQRLASIEARLDALEAN